ncbi:sugar ABC transporter substrate-binding protein [Bifidobacterium longum]|jgi:multiple sugar transport system substrate-binding protein|uniref:Extracellular solute-binding protein, family 1 n=1 Tax=Bifidobacterium longum TaxID=216816 RepID=A0A2N0TIB7_BIFLN|nr:sugar ABC transporter substrate-binding protein [Bifidobacterium longum]MBL3896066.1 sugar ABC transporter substrate-binding protein [Bifidobacterium longum subsp. suis]MCH4839032.1 sugar ABC transporter substrate-binding protein [Bifidobacterium longum]PKD14471.1 extracellular solute-binding protein, family 1 [Bifidobacterium longum]PWH08877.1 sugar ABC transporter substrate-binding protein [Bifidobacterium longum]
MQSVKKAIALTGAAVMMLSMAACGSSSTAGSDKEVSFQTWNLKNDTYTPYFESLIKEFEKDNPGVTVKWIDQPADGYSDKINADAAAGTLPDVVDMSPNGAYSLAKAGVIANLSKDDPKGADQFTDSSWGAVTFKGDDLEEGAYAYPWYLNSGVQYYNTAVLQQCGVTDVPTTMDDFFTAASTIGKNCPGTNMVAAVPTLESLGQYGSQLMNEDQTEFTFNDEKGVELVQHYIDMYKEKSLSADALNNQWTGEGDAFKEGNVASLSGSAYSVSDFEENAPKVYENLAIVERLIGEGGKQNVAMETLVVSNTAKNKDLAMKFARFVTNKKNQTEFCTKSHTFPSVKGAIDDPAFSPTGDSMQDKAVALASKAVKDDNWFASPSPFSENAKTALREQIALAIQGEQTAKEALDKVVKIANEDMK